MGNGILGWIGEVTDLNTTIAAATPYKDGLSFQFLLGYIGAPIVWMIGVDGADMVLVGELLGQKTILNEFIAYPRLGELKASGELSEKIGNYSDIHAVWLCEFCFDRYSNRWNRVSGAFTKRSFIPTWNEGSTGWDNC